MAAALRFAFKVGKTAGIIVKEAANVIGGRLAEIVIDHVPWPSPPPSPPVSPPTSPTVSPPPSPSASHPASPPPSTPTSPPVYLSPTSQPPCAPISPSVSPSASPPLSPPTSPPVYPSPTSQPPCAPTSPSVSPSASPPLSPPTSPPVYPSPTSPPPCAPNSPSVSRPTSPVSPPPTPPTSPAPYLATSPPVSPSRSPTASPSPSADFAPASPPDSPPVSLSPSTYPPASPPDSPSSTSSAPPPTAFDFPEEEIEYPDLHAPGPSSPVCTVILVMICIAAFFIKIRTLNSFQAMPEFQIVHSLIVDIGPDETNAGKKLQTCDSRTGNLIAVVSRYSTVAAVEEPITPPVKVEYTKLLINGRLMDSAPGKKFKTFDPRTGNLIAEVAEGDAEDINRAVAAAHKAFYEGPWPNMTAYEQKFALRFSTPSETENFITSMEEFLSNKFPTELSAAECVIISPFSFQAEYIPPYRADASILIMSPIYASSETTNFHYENHQDSHFQTQDILAVSSSNGVVLPTRFTLLVSSCSTELPLTLAPELQEPGLKSQIAYRVIRASVPKLQLVAFEQKNDIAKAVEEELEKPMCQIVQTLIVDIEPDANFERA